MIVRGPDSYKNLPNKTLRTIAYALSSKRKYTHLLKTDDDCYVRMNHVLQAIEVGATQTLPQHKHV